MSIVIAKGAVKFGSIKAMARSVAAKSGEPESRVYIRLWKRLKAGKVPSKAYHAKPRVYVRKASQPEMSVTA